MNETLVRTEHLTKYYGAKKALNDVNLKIESGKIIGLLGPNGSGKTTLIKLLNGLLKADTGEILINGNPPGVITKSEVSYLPDRPYFGDWMKVADVMNLFRDFYWDFDYERAEDSLKAREDDVADEISASLKALVGNAEEPDVKVAPNHPVSSTTGKFANLQFGPNYNNGTSQR